MSTNETGHALTADEVAQLQGDAEERRARGLPQSHQPDGGQLIVRERARQIAEEGWTPEHDDGHVYGELAMAAAVYAMPDWKRDLSAWANLWPDGWQFKPRDRVRNLVRAGALIAAEIDRLQRAAEAGGEG